MLSKQRTISFFSAGLGIAGALSLALTLVASIAPPAKADLWDRVRETGEDILDPGGWNREAVRQGEQIINEGADAVGDYVREQLPEQMNFIVINETDQYLTYSVAGTIFELYPGNSSEITAYGSNSFYMVVESADGGYYELSYGLVPGRSYALAYDANGNLDLFER